MAVSVSYPTASVWAAPYPTPQIGGEARSAARRVNALLVAGYIAGLYTEFHIYAQGAILVPYALANATGLLLLALNFRRYIARPSTLFLLLLGLNAVFLCGVVINLDADFVDRIRAIAQFNLSLLAGLGAATGLIRIGRHGAARLFAGLALAILAISIFEIYLGGREIVLAINRVLYAWRPVEFYQQDARDLELWGTIRPVAFATEPSLVGVWGMGFFGVSTVLSRRSVPSSLLRLTLFVAALFFVTRSLSVLLLYAGCVCYLIFVWRQRAIAIPALVGAIAVAVPIAFLTGATDRVIAYMQDASFFDRLSAPPLITIDVLSQNPLIGAGIGGEKSILPIIRAVWARSGMFSAEPFALTWSASQLVTNSFFQFWFCLGLAGGAAVCLLLARYVRLLGRPSFALAAVPMIFAWQTVGGMVDARTWAFFFLFMTADMLRRNSAHHSAPAKPRRA